MLRPTRGGLADLTDDYCLVSPAHCTGAGDNMAADDNYKQPSTGGSQEVRVRCDSSQ